MVLDAAENFQGSNVLNMLRVTSMPGFTLSLDCEGLWGMADQHEVVNGGLINDASLRSAYIFILNTLSKNNLKSTAAFVTAFASESDAVLDNTALIGLMAELNPFWFANVLPKLQSGVLNGWSGNKFYRSMSVAGHEMAWHGTTHLPLSIHTSPQAVELELELASRLFRDLGHTPQTIVFPRNQVGHLQRLRIHGFKTYRAGSPNGFISRLGGLANEFNVFDRRVIDKPSTQNGWNVSPAGHFLNWPSGVRALVPISVTVRRWKSLLRSAAESGGYVHMWFHPHNLITAPAMKVAFAEIMCFAGALVKSGNMINLTMADANEYYMKELSAKA